MNSRVFQSVTVSDAIQALIAAGGGPVLAKDMKVSHGSIQGLTNALRHAERHGRVRRQQDGRKAARWFIT